MELKLTYMLLVMTKILAEVTVGYAACGDCGDHGHCSDRNGYWHCVCSDNYHGRNCDLQCTNDETCNGKGTADYSHSSHRCYCRSCHSGYFGNHCEQHCSNDVSCNGRGTAHVNHQDQSCYCTNCQNSYYGTSCENHCSSSGDCNGQGTASVNNDHCECSCQPGYIGSRCQLRCSRDRTCHGRGNCLALTYSGSEHTYCKCDRGFHGSRCELNCTDQDYCHGHGTAHWTHTGRYGDHGHCSCSSCNQEYTGDNCETLITTTSTTTTTTTTAPYPYTSCDSVGINSDQATLTPVSHQAAPLCKAAGSHESTEALALHHCNVPQSPNTWKKGRKVLDFCSDVPLYTPIATFVGDIYPVDQGLVGVLVNCTSANSITMIAQACGQAPSFITVTPDGVSLMDPNVYYTIE